MRPVLQNEGCAGGAGSLYLPLQPLAQAHQPFGSVSRRSGDTCRPHRRQ
jgi:hypothetical protein